MNRKAVLLDQNTYMNIGLLIVLVGGITYVTAQFAQTRANAIDIQELKSEVSKSDEHFNDIEKRLSRIEGKIDTLLNERKPNK